MSEQELLPCPFCGGDVHFGYFAITPNIHCDTCQFEIDGDPDRSDELINRWNTRADIAQAAVAAALEPHHAIRALITDDAQAALDAVRAEERERIFDWLRQNLPDGPAIAAAIREGDSHER